MGYGIFVWLLLHITYTPGAAFTNFSQPQCQPVSNAEVYSVTQDHLFCHCPITTIFWNRISTQTYPYSKGPPNLLQLVLFNTITWNTTPNYLLHFQTQLQTQLKTISFTKGRIIGGHWNGMKSQNTSHLSVEIHQLFCFLYLDHGKQSAGWKLRFETCGLNQRDSRTQN